ncbi:MULTISPECIES: cysteine synthase family protein [unclassified Nonomuraea]|uniref:cysteine synthase family protein n=1 Tax=unclassified Nonomuraea TaxID=2593643 RepID=UPI0035C1664E
MRYRDVIDAVGHTPLVAMRLGRERGVEVFAKLELQNLYGMKDRVAKQVILEARRSGELQAGAPIVESSSGTMALGIAMVGTMLGHEVHIVTDPRIDPLTLAKIQMLGCEVHIVQSMSRHGWQSARLERLAALLDTLPGVFWPRQYSNPQNPAAYRALAGELLDDLGRLDILVGSVGSGGSLCGTTRALRERVPDLRAVAVDCVGSVLFGQPDDPRRKQSGLGNSLMPDNLDHSLIDEIHWLNDREAFTGARELAREQQIFAGNTSGSVYRVLRHLAEAAPRGSRIVGIMPDRGDRYRDSVYDDDYWKAHGLYDMTESERPVRVGPGQVVTGWSYTVQEGRPCG